MAAAWNYWQPPAQAYYGPQPNPHIFIPPGYGHGWAAPAPAPDHQGYRSTKYPQLHPLLASDSSIVKWDVSREPRAEILATVYGSVRGISAFMYGTLNMRLISRHFPWSIEIKSATAITCDAVLDAIYKTLQQPIADSEWGIIDDKLRGKIEKAAKKRVEAGDADKKLKRIDWLGEDVQFRGLERSETFEKARLLPGSEPVKETWLVKMGN